MNIRFLMVGNEVLIDGLSRMLLPVNSASKRSVRSAMTPIVLPLSQELSLTQATKEWSRFARITLISWSKWGFGSFTRCNMTFE